MLEQQIDRRISVGFYYFLMKYKIRIFKLSQCLIISYCLSTHKRHLFVAADDIVSAYFRKAQIYLL